MTDAPVSHPYTTLGVPPDANDEAIRKRYLELIRTFSPEREPARFAAVRAAYEAIRTLDDRARHRLTAAGREDTIDAIIEEIRCRTSRPRPTLAQLQTAVLGRTP